jgi:hypothetical protein
MFRELLPRVLFAVSLTSLVACGGAAAVPDPVVADAPAPVPAPYTPPPAPQIDTRMWVVIWDGIHAMSIFPDPGAIRSEDPAFEQPPYGGTSEHFSLVSHYFEEEDQFGPVIAAATSLDDLLARLAAVELTEVIEQVNPIYAEP